MAAHRPCLLWPDPRLRQPAEPVAGVDDAVRAVWDEMVAAMVTAMVTAMVAMPGRGVGLAAPQLGVMLRLAVVDASERGGQAVRMANPELMAASTQTASHGEGSPNLPGVAAEVSRPAEVTVRYLDAAGLLVEQHFAGLWAASVQHQLEHLAGRMYFDRLGRMKRRMLLAKAARLARQRGAG